MPNMKIINLDSKYVPTQAQLSFAENVIEFGEHEPMRSEDSLAVLASEIPIFLVSAKGMDEPDRIGASSSMDFWGFYWHQFPIGASRMPAIGLCLERMILFAKVLIHELAHAKMRRHPSADYGRPDEFYAWMEEPMANELTLEVFECFERNLHSGEYAASATDQESVISHPMQSVRGFIRSQPPNYQLGLDMFDTGMRGVWWKAWRDYKTHFHDDFKMEWINYTNSNHDRIVKQELIQEFKRQLVGVLKSTRWRDLCTAKEWLDEAKRAS
jgi:hypothetical protein